LTDNEENDMSERCQRCGVLMGRNWHIDVWLEPAEKWIMLVGSLDRKTYVQGLWEGLTNYTRCSDVMRLTDSAGEVRASNGPGGLQIGMESIPHPKRFDTKGEEKS